MKEILRVLGFWIFHSPLVLYHSRPAIISFDLMLIDPHPLLKGNGDSMIVDDAVLALLS